MDNQTTIDLLPQIIEKKLELGLKGATISFKDIEISFNKTISDVGDVISQKLCSVTTERALQLWNAIDAESQYVLAYPETGTFNLELIQKLDIPGDLLCKAFMATHAKDIFTLEAASLPSPLYAETFIALQSELLSTCKQLASKHCGHERLTKFLSSFDCEVLATIIRHEIARYYIDETGTHLNVREDEDEKETTSEEPNHIIDDEDELDMMVGEEDGDIVEEDGDIVDEEDDDGDDVPVDEEIAMMCERPNYRRPDWSLEEAERGYQTTEHDDIDVDDPELFDEPDTLGEFMKAFEKGDTLPATLELTNWLQCNAPEIFSNVRNMLVFHAEERGLPIWHRPNPTEEIKTESENSETSVKETPQMLWISDKQKEQDASEDETDKQSLTVAYDEKEWLRLIRLYTITHPIRKSFMPFNESDLSSQALAIASILVDSGKDTRKLQTFEQLKNAVWNAVGFTAFKKWVDQQPNSARLVESSGKKPLLQDMNFFGRAPFMDDSAILHSSLERSKYAVTKLYGWFSLVKIFWNIADKRPQFIRLASPKDDMLVWEENITCCTLIIQATLGIEKLSFSLQDLLRFCEACAKPQWSETMKTSFETLAEENNAISAVPVFHDYIDFLSAKATNIFRIAEDIKISTEADRERIRKVRKMAEDHIGLITVHGEDPELIKVVFRAGVSKNKAIAGYLEEACGYFDYRFSDYKKTGFGDYLLPK